MQATAKHSRQQIVALLDTHGVIPTRQRIDIAGLLLSRKQHLTAEQVLHQLRQGGCGASKATVYNTLGLLARKGLIRELVIDPGRIVYDSNLNPHYHLFNIDTGELIDVVNDQVNIEALLDLPPDTTAVGVDVVIRIRNQDPH